MPQFKSFAYAILYHIIFIVIGIAIDHFFLHSNNQFLEDQIDLLEASRDSLKTEILLSNQKINDLELEANLKQSSIDSLKQYIRYVRSRLFERQAEIDSLIAIDSSNAVRQYRRALQQLGVIPDITTDLTLREVGYGAKFMEQTYGLVLQINLKDSIIYRLEDLIIQKNAIIIETKANLRRSESLVKETELQTNLYKAAYEDATSFWNNRINLTIGGTSVYVDNKFMFGVGATFGIRVWGN